MLKLFSVGCVGQSFPANASSFGEIANRNMW